MLSDSLKEKLTWYTRHQLQRPQYSNSSQRSQVYIYVLGYNECNKPGKMGGYLQVLYAKGSQMQAIEVTNASI